MVYLVILFLILLLICIFHEVKLNFKKSFKLTIFVSMNVNYSLDETPSIAKMLFENIKTKTLLFYGEMGVGKTTLIKELCSLLGVEDTANSPTFSIVNEYRANDSSAIFHFDFYRIENEDEAYDIGIEDYLHNNNWCFIEWPDNIKNLLPLDSVIIEITLLNDGKRNIQLKTN